MGSFTIPNVAPAHYELSVYGFPDDYYIKSAALGGKDILETGVTYTPGASGAIEIVLAGTGGQVEGVVLNVDQQPATEASVVAVPDEPRRSQLRFHKEDHTESIRALHDQGHRTRKVQAVCLGRCGRGRLSGSRIHQKI